MKQIVFLFGILFIFSCSEVKEPFEGERDLVINHSINDRTISHPCHTLRLLDEHCLSGITIKDEVKILRVYIIELQLTKTIVTLYKFPEGDALVRRSGPIRNTSFFDFYHSGEHIEYTCQKKRLDDGTFDRLEKAIMEIFPDIREEADDYTGSRIYFEFLNEQGHEEFLYMGVKNEEQDRLLQQILEL
jgi:hypothetical protein